MLIILEDVKSFDTTIRGKHLTVVHFNADWAEQCTQVNEVLELLSNQPEYNGVKFCKCDAEELSEVSLRYKIEAAPTVLLFNKGEEIDRVDGVNPALISSKIKKHSENIGILPFDNEMPLDERLKQLINQQKVMLFMKGDRNNPRCGFSRQIIDLLNKLSVEYGTFDILGDEEVRQGLKVYSDWPTYPQLYSNGELIGGLDIVKDMVASGEIKSALNM